MTDGYLLNTRGVGTHQVIARWVRPGSRVLDVGCASGYLMKVMSTTGGCTCVGIESGPAATAAREEGFEVIHGFAPEAFDAARSSGPFDHVVFADVLEHTTDPGPVLQAAADLLTPDGTVIVSLPNIAYLLARLRLLSGRWTYEEHGIFDRTHLRFFTVATARELLEGAGVRLRRTAYIGPLTYRMGDRGLALTRIRPQILASQVVLEGSFSGT
ncbi:methionine biosynthesis protein MetW [Kineococcus xinjiangensis]|uniref:Methionine biosynthesis protein MetW n=1 Tax=Kineococcus xinjiangensis TaxID=512762 RepID=A0A2S6II83_9ACTN|nr:class I SAM-dependent methyltransferase [Kineococcus xinjiangensis]PPK93895.1 methionine biosynthesis protein MetW [Kineococcus xinjiangensis]